MEKRRNTVERESTTALHNTDTETGTHSCTAIAHSSSKNAHPQVAALDVGTASVGELGEEDEQLAQVLPANADALVYHLGWAWAWVQVK